MITRAAILRIQIRNDEALLEHYRQWVASMRPGDLAPAGLENRVAHTLARLVARRDELARLLSPAVTVSHEESLAGSLVTPIAALPGK